MSKTLSILTLVFLLFNFTNSIAEDYKVDDKVKD